MIPYGKHMLEEDDVEAVVSVLRGGMLTQGPLVEEFEAAAAARCGAKHAVAVNSGTAALHLALLAAKVSTGDEITVPAITFLATANCGIHVGADVRFADTDPVSALVTPDLLAPALTERTRAVLPVHFAGLACDMREIRRLVSERCPRAVVIEDACHALGGSHPDGTPIGSLGFADMVMFSFHPVKHVAAGEGGMILTDRDDLAERLRRFRNHGMTKDPALLRSESPGPWYYEMPEVGFNFRMPDLNGALGLSQWAKLDRFVTRRREIAARYHDELKGLRGATLPPPATPDGSAWHIYFVHLDFGALGVTRREVVTELAARGVGTQVHYFPVPLQPYYRERYGLAEGDFPGAERHYERTLTIPLFPGLTDDEQATVIRALFEVIGRR